jgi:Na+/melibiose symporter-like transporter
VKLWQKMVYGSGDWSIASFNTFRQIFYPVFLTDTLGLDPRLAGVASLVGIAWDAVNDPLVGALSDGVRTRIGRRRPFLLAFAVPFGAAFSLLWWAPPWESQAALAALAVTLYVCTDTLQTLVSVPFFALLPELTADYDERTGATAWRMFFNLAASLAVAVGAPAVALAVAAAGTGPREVWLVTGTCFGVLGMVPPLLAGTLLRERARSPDSEEGPGFADSFRAALQSRSFRRLVPVYLLAYTTFDLAAMMIPFFIRYVVGPGSLALGPVELPKESWMLGCMLLVAIAALPAWSALSGHLGKPRTMAVGAVVWAVGHAAIFGLGAGAGWSAVAVAAFIGLGVSCAHVIPDAMVPDVVDEAELTTGRRVEGVFYGARNLFRKMAGALAVFLGLQLLGWAGYDGTATHQPDHVVSVIRVLIGPVAGLLVAICGVVALTHPLTRSRHQAIRAELDRRHSAPN